MIKQLINKIKLLFRKEQEDKQLIEWLQAYEAGYVDAVKVQKEKKKPNETKQTRSKKQPSKQHQRKEKSGNKQTKK
jgi:hypothetical protein